MSMMRRFQASGSLGRHRVTFPSALRENANERPTQTLTLTVPVSHEDLDAVFWWLVNSGVKPAELANPRDAMFYLCDALAHEHTHTFDDARRAITRLRPGTTKHDLYCQIATVVDDLIGARPANQRGGILQAAMAR